MRRTVATVTLLALLVTIGAATPASANHTPAPSEFADFEMDGNEPDNTGGAGDPFDWGSTDFPNAFQTFDDPPNGDENAFVQGSKWQDPGGWKCDPDSSAPDKNDIDVGKIAFRKVNGDQFIYVNFRRVSPNGDAHIDYVFSKSPALHQDTTCASLGVNQRSAGDILIAYDTSTKKVNGQTKKVLSVTAYQWVGDQNSGTWTSGGTIGAQGGNWDAASGDGEKFGEAALNLTQTVGTIECGEFASVFMTSRASTSATAAMKDFTTPQTPLVGDCPDTHLHKAVRNVTDGGTFGPGDEQPSSTNADPGETIEYRLIAHNIGAVSATNVVVTEEVPARSTFLSCGGDVACTAPTDPGPGNTITWSVGTLAGGASATLTFRVQLDAVFPEGTTPVKNTATVSATGEGTKDSNEATVTVSASDGFTVDKTPEGASVNVGGTLTFSVLVTNTGNADGTTVVEDDFDEAHVTVSNISDGGEVVDSGDARGLIIRWTESDIGTIPAVTNNTKTLTYDATFSGPFSGPDGGGDCGEDQFPVINTVTVEDGNDSVETCVTAKPKFDVEKSASQATAKVGDTITYTVTVTNVGDADGTTVAEDDFDEAHVTVGTISNGGEVVDSGDARGLIVQWTTGDIGTIAATNPDTAVTLTYSATFKGPFNGPDGGGNCGEDHFPVLNLVEVEGDSDTTQVCVEAKPKFEVEKTPDTAAKKVGESLVFTITVTNTGDADGTTNVEDDFDEAHVDITGITGGGVVVDSGDARGDIIRWTGVSIAATNPDTSVSFTYTATYKGPFTGSSGQNGCGTDQFAVFNTVTVTGDSDTSKVCVEAKPQLTLAKAAEIQDTNGDGVLGDPGDRIVYTITYANTGDAQAENVAIHEDVPAGTSYLSCSDGCSETGDPVSKVDWTIGTVPAGTSGTRTLTVEIAPNVGCEVCNTATATSGNHATVRSVPDPLCVNTSPGPRPDLANASGSVRGTYLNDTFPVALTDTRQARSSSQSGVGTNSSNGQELNVEVPPPPSTEVDADVIRTTTTSTVSATPAEAISTSTAETVNLSLHGGLVTASVVRTVATGTATGRTASRSWGGSRVEQLVVNGQAYENVTQPKEIPLPQEVFGPNSFVRVLWVEEDAVGGPTPGQLSGGIYSADLRIVGIHLFITDQVPVLAGNQSLEIIVAESDVHADFPQIELCEAAPTQSVSGHAFIGSVVTTSPNQGPIVVQYVDIPPTGGTAHAHTPDVDVPEPSGTTLSTDDAESHSQGTNGATSSTASSYAQAANVCVLFSAGACTVSAGTVRAESNSTADANGAASNAGNSYLANVKVGGVTQQITPMPNQTVPLDGLGFVIFNEQIADAFNPPTPSCAQPGGTTNATGLTTRAIRVVITVPSNPLGLTPGTQIIVAEAHSDACYSTP